MVHIKILTIGDSGVGKTCLLLKYSSGQFSPMFITTIGIDYKLKTIDVNGEEVRLQLWDTAGQERFRTLTASYFKGAHGILMVYDISDRKSFESVSTWMTMIKQQADTNISLVLVGNKCDVDDDQIKVKPEEGQELASSFGIPFHLTSAKTNEGVDEAFLSIAQLVLAKPSKSRPTSGGVIPLNRSDGRRRRRHGCC
jgi:Ras-related protein Rab-8A